MSRTRADASVFHVIADPTRRAMLHTLSAGEATVTQLLTAAEHAGLHASQSALSQHLAVLRRAGLVESRPDGRHRVYSVRPEGLLAIAEFIAPFEKFWTEKLHALGAHLDRAAAKKKQSKKRPKMRPAASVAKHTRAHSSGAK